jgi:uncharacterized protein YaiI (UPF0178 family)
MTKVVVDPGICGMQTTIEVDKVAKRKVKVVITSDCEMVTKLGKLLAEVDQWDVIKQYVDYGIYKAASRCDLHVTCPVPIAVLKAIEVEAGFALPRDVVIRFETTEQCATNHTNRKQGNYV